ncbi:MAG: UDP-N-acetylmuramate dehydrogenase [Gammaproteobacteria bacterium]
MMGQLLYNEPLSNHTSWRVGGPAERFYQPANLTDLQEFLRAEATCDKASVSRPLTWLGLGSNMLVRDGGIAGTVIATQGCLKQLTQLEDLTIRAEAGVACGQLARFSARLGFTGGEFWAGIPGTVGGALAMNAGCFGGETWERVLRVECITRQGKLIIRTPDQYAISYRSVLGRERDEWFVAGIFQLQKGDKEVSLARIRELLQKRTTTQPTNEPSCGSVFRNPPGKYAAELIEACGLKGMRMGQAEVSEKHANFILNKGRATAADIEGLIEYIVEKVRAKHGVTLIREVRILGDRG